MIENYFDQYERIIQPLKHSISTGNNCRQKKSNVILCETSTRDLTTRKEITITQDDFKSQIISERKKRMFLQQENIELKRIIETKREEKKKLILEISQLKNEKKQDREDILRLENLVNHLQHNLSKVKVLTNTESSMSIFGRKVNNDNNSDTKLVCSLCQNQIQCQDVIHNIRYNNNYIDTIRKLENENHTLMMFKEEIIKLSKKYDQYNDSIIESIGKFSDMIREINEKCEKKISIESNIELQLYSEGKQSIDEVLLMMIKYMTAKQDEYDLLLNQKENDINELSNQNKEIIEQNSNMADIITQKTKELENIKLNVPIFKENSQKPCYKRNCISNSSSQSNIHSKRSIQLPKKS